MRCSIFWASTCSYNAYLNCCSNQCIQIHRTNPLARCVCFWMQFARMHEQKGTKHKHRRGSTAIFLQNPLFKQHYYLFYTRQKTPRTSTNIWMLSSVKEGTTALFPGQNDSNWQWWKWHVIGHDLIISCTMLWCRLKLRVLEYRSHSSDSVQVPLQHCSVSVGFSRETEVTGIKCIKS